MFLEYASEKKNPNQAFQNFQNSVSYFSGKTGRVAYTVNGKENAEPLLLLHDTIIGSGKHEWELIVQNLSQNYRVYCLDLPGFGNSEKQRTTYTNFMLVQMLTDFLQQCICKEINIITSGNAANIALMATLYDEKYIKRIIMVNPPRIRKNPTIISLKSIIFKRLIETPIYGTLLFNIHTSREFLERRFQNKYFYNPYNINKNILDEFYKNAHTDIQKQKYFYSSLSGGYLNVNTGKAISESQIPLSIIAGEFEDNGELILRSYKKYNNSIDIQKIEDSKHLPHIEMPKAFVSAIIAKLM